MDLLGKTRKINAMLQKAAGKPVNFKEMAETLCEVIESNVFVVSRRGKLLGIAVKQQIENARMKDMLEARQFPEEYTQSLFNTSPFFPNILLPMQIHFLHRRFDLILLIRLLTAQQLRTFAALSATSYFNIV